MKTVETLGVVRGFLTEDARTVGVGHRLSGHSCATTTAAAAIVAVSILVEAAEEHACEYFVEGLAELDVQEWIENGIECRVEPEQPEGELVDVVVDASRTDGLDQGQKRVGCLQNKIIES